MGSLGRWSIFFFWGGELVNNYWFWVCLGGILCFEYQKPNHKIHNVMLQNIQMWLRGSHLVGGGIQKGRRDLEMLLSGGNKFDIKIKGHFWKFPLQIPLFRVTQIVDTNIFAAKYGSNSIGKTI